MKETHYKLRHRVTALFAAAVMLCSMLPGAAFAEEPTPQPTEETVQMEQQTEPSETDNGQTDESSPDPGAATAESAAPTTDEPAEEKEPYTFAGDVLYQDMPDTPTGSYLGSYGLPVATGETKIGLGAWDADLEQTNYLSAEALDSDNLTLAAPLLEDTDYAIVPILAQVEYPTDGSSLDLILPDGVTLLDYHGAPVENAQSLLHSEYSETSAAVLGVYVQADADFTAQLVYTAPDGSALTKTLQVTIDRNAAAEYPFPNSEIAAFAERPTPAVTSGKITKVAKVNGTWLIWFNGEPAYCCTHGANGQPAGCPTYTYVNTSTVGADQCIPGDHYGNQIRIWGGLNQLSLGDADDLPAVFSADKGEEISLLNFCASIYDDVQMYIIENFPESTAAEIYLASADELLNGVETYASARGYYTYIYNPGRAGWQTVALIGPEIGEEEPEPEPVVQEYYASWEAPAQTASGSFDFSYGIRTDKIQLKTQEKVDGATIEIEPITKSGSIEGGSWSISPAGKQTVTTSGHTADDNYQKNGGDAGASWSLHYAVTKTSGTRNGQVGPFTTQEAADAAANSARDAAMDMILECKVSEDSYDENRMDILFGELEQRDPHHPAVLQYRSFKLGSAKTLSSIMVTAVSNLHMLQSAAFAEMIATDEMFLPKLGVEKRAIFCVIPDNDDTFNFMVSILYTQLFDQLFRLADSTPEFHGTLPVHVRLMMDEFANVATPENFVKILAVARSRNISCDIILQNISQIKSKYKDDWETIIGNCDSLVYLGGNDYSTFEYISKLLGKQTIRTKGQSIGKGSHGSSSDSYQVTGRELMTPDEVRRMKRSDCLVMISGEAPVRDKKYNLFDHPNLKYTPDYRSPRGLLHRFATPIPAPEGYTMPPDYMAQAGTVSLAYVAELTCPEITEDLYDELQEWEESLL